MCFTPLFGAFCAPQEGRELEWNTALPFVARQVEKTLPAARVQQQHREYREKAVLPAKTLLHRGGDYGGLEQCKRRRQGEPLMAPHLHFPHPGGAFAPWRELLESKRPAAAARPWPYLTDPRWLPLLKEAAGRFVENAELQFQYAVSLAENGRVAEAAPVLEALAQQHDPFALHALGAAGLAEVWFEYQARRKAQQEGTAFSPQRIDRTLPLPPIWTFGYSGRNEAWKPRLRCPRGRLAAARLNWAAAGRLYPLAGPLCRAGLSEARSPRLYKKQGAGFNACSLLFYCFAIKSLSKYTCASPLAGQAERRCEKAAWRLFSLTARSARSWPPRRGAGGPSPSHRKRPPPPAASCPRS